MRFINYFRKSVPVATPYPGNEDAQQRYYKKLRLQVLIAALLSHSLYYVCRTTLNVVKEPILDNGALNATQLGMIGSAMLFVYAVGKFVNGFLADYSNIKRFMAAGLILGYIAMEYSIWYSLLLHISNNLILGDVLPRIAGIMPGNSGNILYNVITNLLVILGIVLLLRKYRSIPRICSSESHNTGKLLFLYFRFWNFIYTVLYLERICRNQSAVVFLFNNSTTYC